MARALIFESERRFAAFHARLEEAGVACESASFDDPRWHERDFSSIDLVIYYPAFEFSSNHPLALSRVKDALAHLGRTWPKLSIYPDPCLFEFYNDKYRQALYLQQHGLPTPPTVPLVSERAVAEAAERLGFPMVVKNRFGAGGDNVEKIEDPRELRARFEMSRMNYWNLPGAAHLLRQLFDRTFLYWLIRRRRMAYPFRSWPLLAQKFVRIERDLKTVVGQGRVVEGHWRRPASPQMWKMNIDGGAIGEWSEIPDEPITLSQRLAGLLGARWLNVDLIESDGRFLITEFSPVWHHYRYREKPDFVYKDDYNIDVPLEESLDLERMIVRSLVESVGEATS